MNFENVTNLIRTIRFVASGRPSKEFSLSGDVMVNKKADDFLDLSTEDQELKRFFQLVRQAGRLVVKDGDDEFVVEFRRATVTLEARRRLTGGGPEV